MSTAMASPMPDTGTVDPGPALSALLQCIAGNRFLPHPPAHRRGSGDGDFRAIGCEFLGYFVRLCGLTPHQSMLDLGCGIGRFSLRFPGTRRRARHLGEQPGLG